METASCFTSWLAPSCSSVSLSSSSSSHLADAGFHRALIDHLDAYDVSHHDLQIEVTERVLLEASHSAMTGLRALRDVGVQVGLDDFGTGYSSLAYLRQFPVDALKIEDGRVVVEQEVRGQTAAEALPPLLSKMIRGIPFRKSMRWDSLETDPFARPVHWIVPFPPGGSAEIISRVIANRLLAGTRSRRCARSPADRARR